MVPHRHFSQMHSQIFLCHTRKVSSFKGSISSKSDPYRQCISRLSRYEKSTFLICLYTYIYYIFSYLFSKCLFRLLLDNSQFSLCSKLQTSNCSYKFLPVSCKDLFWLLVKMLFDSLAKTKIGRTWHLLEISHPAATHPDNSRFATVTPPIRFFLPLWQICCGELCDRASSATSSARR